MESGALLGGLRPNQPRHLSLKFISRATLDAVFAFPCSSCCTRYVTPTATSRQILIQERCVAQVARVLSAGQSGVSIKLAAGETAFESWCLVYIHCYQEAGSKVGIYNAAAWKMPSVMSSAKSGTSLAQKTSTRLAYFSILPYSACLTLIGICI